MLGKHGLPSALPSLTLSVAEYPDPLLPRQGTNPQFTRTFPPGTEERLLHVMAQAEAAAPT